MSRGENDWADDFWDDWWNDTFEDDSWYDGSWSDGSSNDSNDPLDTSNDNFFQTGTDGWGDDVYYNSDDGNYYIDIDGDGFVDSAYVNDGYDESDSGDGWSSGDGSWTPVDPDPLPDPGDAPTDSGGEPEEIGGGSGETDNNSPEEVSSQKTPEELKSAVKSAVKYVIDRYGRKQAYCNVGVVEVFKALYGSKEDLNNKNANSMVRYWRSHPENWERISIGQAQSLANQGYFVVAGWINPQSGHSGHVVVVVPGEEGYSKNWGGKIPNVMDTGENKRTESQTINYSFGKYKISGVEFYKYK